MNIFLKIAIGILITFQVTYAEMGANIEKYISPNQPAYTKGNIAMECPVMRSLYIARVDHYEFSTGKTFCKVYKIDQNTNIPSDTAETQLINNYNPYAEDYYNNVSESRRASIDAKLKRKWDSLGKDIASGSAHKALQTKYFKNYVTTGDEFLTGSKYLLAGITMDGEIINIKKSIDDNEVRLNAGYTIYPNSSTNIDTRGFFQKLWDKYGWGEGVKEIDNEKSWEAQELQTQAKEMLNNLIVFIMDFFAELNETYQDVTFWMLIMIIPFTAFFGIQKWATTKGVSHLGDSPHNHQDDYLERMFLGALVFIFFYVSMTTYKIDDEKNIDQTMFQNSSRFMLYKGMDWADEATRAMAKSYVSFKMKDAGIIGKEKSKELEYEVDTKNLKRKSIEELVIKCFEYYDVGKIKTGVSMGVNQNFSSDRSIYDYMYLNEDYKGIERKEDGSVKDVPTIHACYKLVRDHQILNTEIKEAQSKIANYDSVLNGNGIAERMNLMAEYIYKNTADNGFIASPMIGATNIFLDGTEAIMTKEKREQEENKKSEKLSETIASGNLFGTSSLEWITDKAVYMMVGGASSLRETIYSLMKPSKNKKNSWYGDGSATMLSLVFSIVIIMAMIKYAPILALITASILTIVFYYISVEIFYLVSPFIIVYAFATNQQQFLISLLSRFMALVLKPLAIVLSIVLAMLAVKMFDGINTAMVTANFDMFQQILKVNMGDGFFDTIGNAWNDSFRILGISFIGSVIKLLITIFATLGVFYLVFNGASMMMAMLGFKESGIDVQESIGREVEGGASKYNKPV